MDGASMSPLLQMFPRIIGIDFSGAVDAGRKIWVTDAVLKGDALHVRTCRPGSMLRRGAGKRLLARDPAHIALRRFLDRVGDAVVGCDFPFSLGRAFIPYDDWETFAATFARDFPSAQDMHVYTSVLGTDLYARGERVTRQTDRDARTPFSPHNLRLFRQTYHGIRDILAPLALNGRARVLPMQPYESGMTTLIEICPASLLQSARLYRPYKGRGAQERKQRKAILAYFSDPARGLHLGRLTRTVRQRAIHDAEGDALDSLLAAYSAALALVTGELYHQPQGDEAIEGRVYGYDVRAGTAILTAA